MKIMIRSDIEGVTGVTTYEQAENSEFGRSMLMNDLNACINGILSTGNHEIVTYDEHTDGRNSEENIKKALEDGFTFIAVGVDTVFLNNAASQSLFEVGKIIKHNRGDV